MGERTSYPHGTFSWVELSTPDQDGAKQFYGELFGWTAQDNPMGDGTVYTMMSLEDRVVAAVAPQPAQQREAGVPPLWNNYVTVESADDAAARAGELGAHVHAGPFDVLTAGRMAVLQDPQGAFVMVWEPKDHIGAALVNVPGTFTWNELASPDPEGSQTFYGDLFGWTFNAVEAGGMEYWAIALPSGRPNGGIRRPQPGEPPNWSPYFGVEDVEASMARVAELGGERLAGPMQVGPGGTVGVVRDPGGAVFSVYAGEFDDE